MFLPNNGAFFVNYLVTSALIGTALELCRFPELVSYAGNMACARNEGEKRLIRKVREHEDSDIRTVACVAGVIGEGEGERGSREKMRGIGERGEGTPATRTPFDSFPPNDFRLIKLPYPSITVISSTNQNQARVSLHD